MNEERINNILEDWENLLKLTGDAARVWVNIAAPHNQPYGVRIERGRETKRFEVVFGVGHYDGLMPTRGVRFPIELILDEGKLKEHARNSAATYKEATDRLFKRRSELDANTLLKEKGEIESRIQTRTYEFPEGFPYNFNISYHPELYNQL